MTNPETPFTTLEATIDKQTIVQDIIANLESRYQIVETNQEKPWGAYIRITNEEADQFISEFFPGLDPIEARLGEPSAELSPKVLLVSPGQRLSWQYHHRRAERWRFLSEGSYNKSMADEEGEPVNAQPGEVVQFQAGERHRLNGVDGNYVVVAEIWQHVDAENPSDEDDIIRLADDYAR